MILLNAIEGRDKITKILQFAAKFLAWDAVRNHGDKETSARYLGIAGKVKISV